MSALPTAPQGALAAPPALEAAPGRRSLLRRVAGTWSGAIGLAIVALVAFVALAAPLIAPHDPLAQDLTVSGILGGPSGKHLLGTDDLGRDTLSRVLYGSRPSLLTACAGVALACLLGVAAGTVAGSFGAWCDRVVMRLTDALLAFPLLVLAIAFSVAVGRGIPGLVLAITAVNFPIFTRLARAETLRINGRQYMVAARAMGCGPLRRIVVHVVPNLVNPLIVQASVALSFAIITEAGLSFLGLGVQAPTADWGLMIASARTYLAVDPWMMFAPAVAILITVLGLNLLGDGLSDALDPRVSAD